MRSDELGFICEFKIYIGKLKDNENCELGESVVINLTKSIVSEFYHVYFDNFFLSVNLLITLRSNDIFACDYTSESQKLT